jgi:hypothetical protein
MDTGAVLVGLAKYIEVSTSAEFSVIGRTALVTLEILPRIRQVRRAGERQFGVW